MKKTLTATQLAVWRTFPQRSQYFIALHTPATKAFAPIDIAGISYPGSTIKVGATQGGTNLTDIKAGMTLWVGTSNLVSTDARGELGQLRVRKDYSAGSLIDVAEYGSGLVSFQTGACVFVLEDYRPWPIHPAYDTATSRWKVDLDFYTSQTRNLGPQVIMGPPMIGWLENGKMLASYVGDLSYSHTPGVSITSQLWTFPNGQTVSSALGSSQNPIVITYTNASSYGAYHTLKVTDSNGASHIGQRLTFAFIPSSAGYTPRDCRFEQITGGLRSGGYRTKIYVDEGAPNNSFMDGAKVIIFERSSYGSHASSIGGNYFGRDNIVLSGRVVADSQRIEPFTKGISFDLETEDGEMRKAQGYDLFLESGSAASDWDMASGLTLDRAAIILAKYRSTIANVMDFHPASGVVNTQQITFRELPPGFLWDQLNYNYAAGFGLVAMDMQGTLWASPDIQVTGLSANVANVMSINQADRRDTITIDHPHRDNNSLYRLYAVQGGTYYLNADTTSRILVEQGKLAAESPGDRSGYFGQKQEISQNLAAPDMDTLITWAGNLRARDNNPYTNIVIPLAGNMRLDPVPQSYVTMSLSATQSPRVITWDNQKLIPTEITLTYNGDGQYTTSEIIAETLVNGIGGSAFTPPTVIVPPSPPPPDDEPCPPGYHEDADGNCVSDDGGDGNTVYVATTSYVGRTRNFLSASPTWTNVTGNLASLGTGTMTIRDFCVDPYDPGNKGYVLAHYATSGCLLLKTTNLNSSPPTWSDTGVLLPTYATKIRMTIIQENFMAVYASDADHNGGAAQNTNTRIILISDITVPTYVTHNIALFNGGTHADGDLCFQGMDVSQHIGPYTYMVGSSANFAVGATDRRCLLVSLSSGTPSFLMDGPIGNPYGYYCAGDFLVPYDNNGSDSIMWGINYVPSGAEPTGLYYSSDRGNTWADRTPGGFTMSRGYCMNVATNNRSVVYVFRREGSVSDTSCSLYYSNNEGASWATRQTGMTEPRCLGIWPYDADKIFFCHATAIVYSSDQGVTLQTKTGDWATAIAAFASPVMITPIWVDT